MGEKTFRILAINPGSTSTKIAIYEKESETRRESIEHPRSEIDRYKAIVDQYPMRKDAVLDFLHKAGYSERDFDAIVARGGTLPPVRSGAYRINKLMVETLRDRPQAEHVSNLAAMIAFEIAQEAGIPSFIYDSVAVDELDDIARLTGLAEIRRRSLSHALNMRAAAIRTAAKLGRPYEDLNIIVAHLGGGITISLHRKGRMADIVSDDEGTFSPERAGRLPALALVDLCYSGKYEKSALKKLCRGAGGLVSLVGTADAQEVERRIAAGDKEAELAYSAMAYQIAKGIGELAVAVDGAVDSIVLTGGIAHSKLLTGWIEKRVRFISPVEILPGENELESLALGALRVLRGREPVLDFDAG